MKKKLLSIGLALTVMFGWQTISAQISIDLSGTTDKAETTYNFDIASGFTLEYKVYMNVLQNYNAGVTKGASNIAGPIDTYISVNGSMTIFIGDGFASSATSLPSGTFIASRWYHIAITANPALMQGKVYVDGVLMSTYNFPALGNTPNPMIIGDRIDNATNSNALYDNVRVWSGVRTDAEIIAYKDSCLTGSETGLEILYQMEEGTGTVLNDLAIFDGVQNGTVVNGGTWGAGLACGSCIQNQVVNTASFSAFCSVDTLIEMSSSETTINYYLRDNANDSIVTGPLVGTGNVLNFNTGPISSSMTYNIYGTNSKNALNYDGVNDKVDCGNPTSAQVSNMITLEAWIYPTGWQNGVWEGNIINKENNSPDFGYMLRCGNNGSLNFNLGDGAWNEVSTPSGTLTLNSWQHVAATYDGAIMTVYVNGVIVATQNSTNSFSSTNANLSIGNWSGGTQRGFIGSIDDVSIWSVARTITEINADKNNEFSFFQPGLVHYYNFNQGLADGNNVTDTILLDNLGNGNNGSLINFALTSTVSNWVINSNQGGCAQKMDSTVTITILDGVNPTITAPVGVSVVANAPGCIASGVSLGTETATDNCSTPTVTNDAPTTFPLGATTVTWTATDAVGNTTTAMQIVTVTSDLAIASSPVVTNATCNGNTDGAINITVSGGTMAYSYSWDNASTTEDLTGLGAGSYTVTLTDANGCTDNMAISVTEPAVLALTAVGIDEMNGNDGTINLTVSGGTTAYGYSWDNASTTEDLTGLTAGTYVVTVTDANGCVDSLSVIIDTQVGIEENGISAVIYPNPTSGIVTIEFAQMLDGTITVLDGIGKVVLTERITNIKQIIDLSNNERGIYFLQISKGDSRSMIKIVLQ